MFTSAKKTLISAALFTPLLVGVLPTSPASASDYAYFSAYASGWSTIDEARNLVVEKTYAAAAQAGYSPDDCSVEGGHPSAWQESNGRWSSSVTIHCSHHSGGWPSWP